MSRRRRLCLRIVFGRGLKKPAIRDCSTAILRYIIADCDARSRASLGGFPCLLRHCGSVTQTRTSQGYPPPTKCTISSRSPVLRIVRGHSSRGRISWLSWMAIRPGIIVSRSTRPDTDKPSWNSRGSPLMVNSIHFPQGQNTAGLTRCPIDASAGPWNSGRGMHRA